MLEDREFMSYSDGIFKPYFEKFILYKRSKGERVAHSALSRMKHLNDALNAYGVLEVTREMADEILAPRSDTSDFTRYARITHLRQFLGFLRLFDIECCRLPLKYARPVHCRFRPYIFSNGETTRLVDAADNVRIWNHRERRTEIYPTLLRILIGTGMRIGETLALKRSDVDIGNGIVRVVNGKNGVCRYIPVSDTLNVAIREYMVKDYDGNELMFPSPETGGAYSHGAIASMFRKLCTKAEICRTDGKTPNIHSLRHTFCSKSLEQLLSSGMNLYTAMPILAAYVGHVNFRDTESYIHFTENGYREFLEKESPLGRLIPEVKCNA